MKRLFTFILLLFFVIHSYAQDRYLVETKSVLNVRASNSANAPIIGSLKNGTTINVYEIDDDWAKIAYQGERIAYVSSKYLVQISDAVPVDMHKIEYNANKIPWYDPMGWGIIGWFVRWGLIPFIVFGFGIAIPVMLLAEIRVMNNFFVRCISYIIGLFLVKLYITLLQTFDVYCGSTENIILWVFGVIFTMGGISTIINSRCPNCHYNDSNIINSTIKRRTRTTTTKYRDGSKKTSSISRDTTHNHHQCPECGYDWWAKE